MNRTVFNHSILRHALLALSVSSIALSASAAHAQDEPDAAADGEIVVTARKTNERLQDVPISVNALSGDQLRDRGAVDVKDVLRSIPGFSFSGTERGLGNYNIRGVSTVASSPTVGVYLDDISLVTVATSFSGAFDPVFFDMERLEVLKGPQGTLYGGSSMGGAIKYVSAKPNLRDFGASVAVGAAITAHGGPSYNGELVINAPLVEDRLALRAGVFYRHDGGYIDNGPGSIRNANISSSPSPVYTPAFQPTLSTRDRSNQNASDTYAARLSLEWQPDPSWSIRPAVFFQDYKLRNPGQFFLGGRALTSSFRIAQPTDDKAGIYSLNIDKDLGGVRLTSLTAYFDRDLNWVRDYSYFIGGLVAPLFPLTSRNVSDSETTTFSQELRLASNGGLAFIIRIRTIVWSRRSRRRGPHRSSAPRSAISAIPSPRPGNMLHSAKRLMPSSIISTSPPVSGCLRSSRWSTFSATARSMADLRRSTGGAAPKRV